MDKEIEKEQKKLADNLHSCGKEEMEKKLYGALCWMQGHEAGYQAGLTAKEEQK